MFKCASFFAGVGGIDLGFEETGAFETVYANEIDKYPAKTFELNHNIKVDIRDIHEVKSEEIPDFDIMLAGFPCQAFSVAGLREGFNDKKGRGDLFFELIRIIKDKQPRVVFLENVKNLANHDEGRTFSIILQSLEEAGYCKPLSNILNAMEYGNIPQNRERIYIVVFKNEEDRAKFNWPSVTKLNKTVRDVIDFDTKIDEKYYYTPGKYKGCIYEELEKSMRDDDPNNPSIYQWRRIYVRKNKSNVIPTLTANQGEGGHNVCLVKTKYGIRKMTPRECFNAQGFPEDYILPSDVTDSKLYKQAGNSVCVTVINSIAEKIKESLI